MGSDLMYARAPQTIILKFHEDLKGHLEKAYEKSYIISMGFLRNYLQYQDGGKIMTKAEILKKEILRQYRSVRQFALEMGIPYSTLVTALERGIEGMAYGTVIKMCDKLSLNPVDFTSLERDTSLGAQLLENRVMQYYVKLNQTGRDKILELMDDFVQIDKYKAKGKKAKSDKAE